MKRTKTALWVAILIPPVAWLLSLEANFALVPLACSLGGNAVLFIAPAIAVGLAILAGRFARNKWRQDAEGMVRTMAVAGMSMSAMFTLVVIAQTIPQIVLRTCQ